MLESFKENMSVVVFGASGGIGSAAIDHLIEDPRVEIIHAVSRSAKNFDHDKVKSYQANLKDEASIKKVAEEIKSQGAPDVVFVATGILHDGDLQPEKALRDMNSKSFGAVFAVNCFGPAFVMKHFLPLLPRDDKTVFAAISARVGSISDNHLGGWYAYRASKAALNMLIKNAAIELARKNKNACVIGLHPGTVNTNLSEPFQGHVPENKLFSPEYSAERLLKVIDEVDSSQTGLTFAYDGEVIPF